MTTATPARAATWPARAAHDASFSPSFARQVLVELRKMVNTISGTVLLALTLALVLVVTFAQVGLAALIPELGASPWGALLTSTTGAASLLLPVVGIMSVTSEWSQRTLLTTFTLEPRRLRIVAAKLAAGVVIALGSVVLSLVVTIIATPIGAAVVGESPIWEASAHQIIGSIAMQVLAVLAGMALALLILNTPAAICAYVGCAFVLPMVLSLLSLWEPMANIAPWLNFNAAQSALTSPMDAQAWGHLLVSGTIWFIAPLVLGCIRVHRSEVA